MNGADRPPLRIAVWCVTVLLVVASWEPFYFRALLSDRAQMRLHLLELPFSKLPGFRRLLQSATAIIETGAVVVISLPGSRWDGGYEYAYARSLLPLAGREVIPLVGPENLVNAAALARADWIVHYSGEVQKQGFSLVYRSKAGSIYRRDS